MLAPPWRVGAPTSGKSWIRHCINLVQIPFFFYGGNQSVILWWCHRCGCTARRWFDVHPVGRSQSAPVLFGSPRHSAWDLAAMITNYETLKNLLHIPDFISSQKGDFTIRSRHERANPRFSCGEGVSPMGWRRYHTVLSTFIQKNCMK